jgi:hypothetical protein
VANPLSRRLLQLAGLLSLLLIAVVVNYLLHDGSDAINPIAEAAQRTAAMPGARLKFEVTYTTGDGKKSATGIGTGEYDARTGRSRAILRIPTSSRGPLEMQSISDGRTVYLRSSILDPELPRGKEWMAMEPLLGHSAGTAFGADAGTQGELHMLEAVGGGVEQVDQQSVGGQETTRYRATIDMHQVARFLKAEGEAELGRKYEEIAQKMPATIPVEVWVDGSGVVRKMRIVETLPDADTGSGVTMDMRMELSGFGAQPKVALPPRRSVLDVTPALRAELGLIGDGSLGRLSPPEGAKPLSVDEFRRRVRDVCGEVLTKAEGVLASEESLFERLREADRSLDATGATAKPLFRAYGLRIGEPTTRLERRANRKLAAVDPPVRYRSAYRRYLALDVKQEEWDLAATRTLELGIVKSPVLQRHDDAIAEKEERRKLADRLGVPSCEKTVHSPGSTAQTEVE